MYRRPASKYKRPTYNQNKDEPENVPIQLQTVDIPMPNEADIPSLTEGDSTDRFMPFSLLGRDFYLDDLILIGLLIFLIHEKVEDEILLIVIAYILIF